ncbi:Peptide chain release factor 1, partial [hydrothermal vent metagenome]
MLEDKFENIQKRFVELERLLADPEVISDQSKYQKLAKEYSDLAPLVEAIKKYVETVSHIKETEALLKDEPDSQMKELAQAELDDLEKQKEELQTHLDDLLNPKKQVKD